MQQPLVGYGYSFSWSPEPYGRITSSASGYATSEEAEEAFRRDLIDLRYTKPRWWQWWRWGEHLPAVLP